MNTILDNLNPEQLAAVTMPSESALILAGAGSGKTRVLTTRIAWLLQTSQVSPSGILAVTFTNKAAKEMLARLSALCPFNTNSLWVGTFHGLCNHFLRLHHHEAALPQGYIILDAQDQLSMVKRIIKAQDLDENRYPARTLTQFINNEKEHGYRADAVSANDQYTLTMKSLYKIYENQCQTDGVVDFAELLLRCCELLENNGILREHYQQRFSHLLVDEFQDTNNLQYHWLKLLAGKQTSVFAVGDDDQSIYSFRGANVNNMQSFLTDFKVKKTIRLEQNYRSFGNILDAANALISNNKSRLGKNLRTDAPTGNLIKINELDNDLYEAQWVLDEISSLTHESLDLNDIAILYRSNAQSRVLEHALFSAGIPYRVHGGLRFFDRTEIKHAIAYLQLVDNPNNNAAFLRVVNFPTRGIGSKTIERLQDLAQQQNTSLFNTCESMQGKAGHNLTAFTRIITSIKENSTHLSLPDLVELILKSSGLITHYEHEKEGVDRIENLEQLVSASKLFLLEEGYNLNSPAMHVSVAVNENTQQLQEQTIIDADVPLPSVMSPLSGFLSHASLEAGEVQANNSEHAVQLMTIHASKGLEFPAIFITGLEEGLFPHENSIANIANLEEERRLMYVAITRAKKHLFLSFARSRMLHGQTRYGIRSRFIDELPTQTLRWLSGDPAKRNFSPVPFVSAKKTYVPTDSSLTRTNISSSSSNTQWYAGKRIEHTKFGIGTIRKIEGNPPALRALIDFDEKGTKLLDLTVARLSDA